MARHQQTYDHRLRELVRQTGDLTIAISAGVPRSTASGWLRSPGRTTVTMDALSMDQQALQAEVARLQGRVAKLRAVARILVATMKALDVDLSRRRIPNGDSKFKFVRAVEGCGDVLKLRKAPGAVGCGHGSHGIAAQVTQAPVTSTRRQKSRMSPSLARRAAP